MLRRKEIASIVGISFLFGMIPLGIHFGWWKLTDFLTLMPYFIIASIIGLFAYGFIERIDNFFDRLRSKRITQVSLSQKPKVTSPSVTKILGTPDSVKNGIQDYRSRQRIPLDVLLSEATKRLDMLAITFHEITTSNIKLIEETIYRNVRTTFIILRADSEYARNRGDDFHEGEEIPHHIERSLSVLCELKHKVGQQYKDNLIIKTYDTSIDNSIIIIDNKLIKVESHVKGSDPNTRPNRLVYRADNEPFFEQYKNEFNAINTEIYDC